MSGYGGSDQAVEKALTTAWWEERKGHVHPAVWATVNFIQENQQERRNTLLRNARLYIGNQLEGFGPYTYARLPTNPFRASDRLTLNVIASNVDTLTSKQAKNRPRPRFLTIEGDFSQQRRAKNLQKFIDGIFYDTQAYGMGTDQFRDACWAGTGITYWYRQGGKIMVERVFPGELLVDQREAIYGTPRQMFRVKYVDRQVLREIYPEKWKSIIKEADAVTSSEFWGVPHDQLRDQLKVIESWHLPSGEDATDGRYTVSLENGTLEDEKWTRPDFPFVIMRFRKPLLGFWGTGVADELTGIQVEINKLLRKIQDAFHLLAVPWVLRERGSQVNPQKITNQPGIIIDYTGTPPQVVTHATVHPEVFAHLDRLIQRSYEITGVSMLSASSQKPAGLDSGRALQEYHDIESERFMEVGRRYEQMFLDYATQAMQLAEEIEADPEHKGTRINAISPKGIEPLRWRDVKIAKDAMVMQMFPSSALPTQPAAKIQQIITMMQGQLIDPAMGQKLLEFPDIEAYTSLRDAPIEDIEAQIEVLLDGRYEPPEPFQDLDRAVVMVQSAYLRARRQGASDNVLDGLRRYLTEVGALKGRIQEAAMREQQAQQMEQQAAQQQGQQPPAPGGLQPALPSAALPPQAGAPPAGAA